MEIKHPRRNQFNGRFVAGQSGNPAGRPKGSTGHAAELRRLEDEALKLAINVADIIAETATMVLVEIKHPELTPLFNAITKAAKKAIRGGEIGPSSLALLRAGFDDHLENGDGSAFFTHAGLPAECKWKDFKMHYTRRGRIDFGRHAGDLRSFPPIASRIKELREQTPDNPCLHHNPK
jgi:hypothetical protein